MNRARPCVSVYTSVGFTVTFDWDPAKSDQNLAERGFGFAFGAVVRRVISARLSNRKERRRYAESLEAIAPDDDRA